MAFYDIFQQLCDEKGVTPTKAARDNGIPQSVVSMWKKRGSIPAAATLILLSEYFHTTPAYLMGNPMAKNPDILDFQSQTTNLFTNSQPNKSKAWKSRKDEIGEDLTRLNEEGQIEAVKRVKELTEISRYQYKP